MSKNKHLNLDGRYKIQLILENKASFSSIATTLEKYPTTISKKSRNHLQYKKIGAYQSSYNSCSKRVSCLKSHIYTECHTVRRCPLCRRCSMRNAFCKDFEKNSANVFWNRPMSVTATATAPNATLKNGSIMLTLPIGNTVMSFQNPAPIFLIPKTRSVILMNSFLLWSIKNSLHITSVQSMRILLGQAKEPFTGWLMHVLYQPWISISQKSTLQCTQSGVSPKSLQIQPHLRGL